jgi:hypothetical protein
MTKFHAFVSIPSQALRLVTHRVEGVIGSATEATMALEPVSKRIMRSVYAGASSLLLVGGVLSVPALADNGAVTVAPNPFAPGYADTIRLNQGQVSPNGRQMGQILANATQNRRPTEIVLTIKCNHFTSATLGYADGSVKSVNMSNLLVDRKELARAQAALPFLRVVEDGCDS